MALRGIFGTWRGEWREAGDDWIMRSFINVRFIKYY
jgi:hypothetical protein